jgi:transcriptional regulator
MYRPTHFEPPGPQAIERLVAEHPLGWLVTGTLPATAAAGGAGPTLEPRLTANPLPWRWVGTTPGATPGALQAGDSSPTRLVGHVARANPVWRETPAGSEVLVLFQGPQAYVTPSWYPGKTEHGKVVPTWNYVVAQARGRLRIHDDREWLRSLVGDLTDQHEARREHPWAVSDAPQDYIETMLRAIVGVEVEVVEWTGKWKVSQNRLPADRLGVQDGLRAEGGPAADLADWMPG